MPLFAGALRTCTLKNVTLNRCSFSLIGIEPRDPEAHNAGYPLSDVEKRPPDVSHPVLRPHPITGEEVVWNPGHFEQSQERGMFLPISLVRAVELWF